MPGLALDDNVRALAQAFGQDMGEVREAAEAGASAAGGAALVAARARDAAGVVPQQFGDGAGGWQVAINAAITELSSGGGGKLVLPQIPGGYSITGDIILRDRVELAFETGAFVRIADGSNNVRAIATHRFNEFSDDPRNRSDAPRGWKITNGWIEGNAANVTTSGGPWDGVGCALYGADFDIDGLRIYNAKGHSLLTFFDGWTGGVHGWNGRARNVYLDGAGRHGWWNRVSDMHVEDVNITQVSQDANLEWDGMLLERSVRMVNYNSWNSTLRTSSFMRAGINVQTGGVTIDNAHIETAATCLLINGDHNMVQAFLYSGMGTFYCSAGGNFNKLDLTITNASNWFDTFRALQLGRAGESAAYNQIALRTGGTNEAIVEFTNSAGYNSIKGNCFTTSAGELFRGSPTALDEVSLQGSYNGVYKDYKKDAVFSGTTAAAGTDQATATLIERNEARVTGGDGTVGVRLRPAFAGMTQRVTNSGSGVLKVYPASGNQFSLLGLNVAYDLPAFTTVTFGVTNSSVWVVV